MMSREKLFNLFGNKIYKHNEGTPGKYYNAAKSFFIDVVFPDKADFVLNTVEWITEVLNTDNKSQEFATLTHITAWNNYQCTGRVSLFINL